MYIGLEYKEPQIPMWNKLRLLLGLPFFPLAALYFCGKMQELHLGHLEGWYYSFLCRKAT